MSNHSINERQIDRVHVHVKRCQRCGEDHDNLEFVPLFNPADDFTHWTMCPKTNQPVTLAIRQT